MKTFKKILKWLSIVTGCFVFLVIMGMVYISWGSKDRLAEVDKMCTFQPGTDLNVVIDEGRKLEFRPVRNGAIIEIQLITPDKQDKLPAYGTDEEIQKFQDGEIIYGKVVVKPFLRHFCTLTIKDRKVVSTRRSSID